MIVLRVGIVVVVCGEGEGCYIEYITTQGITDDC